MTSSEKRCDSSQHCPCCRSVILTCMLLFWLPFGLVTDTLTDIWHVLMKWNQYVMEYEKVSLGNDGTGAQSPFADAKVQTSHPPHQDLGVQQSLKQPASFGKFAMQNLLQLSRVSSSYLALQLIKQNMLTSSVVQ